MSIDRFLVNVRMLVLSSRFSFINQNVGASLYLSENKDSECGVETFVKTELFSRIAALFISASAAIDIVYHSLFTPLTLIYAIGKSIIRCKADFSLPLEHLERVRQAIFPLLFGSLFGVLHPHLGAMVSESKEKFIGYGILLSGTKKNLSVICSPLTTYKEIIEIGSLLASKYYMPYYTETVLKPVLAWEAALEKIQSIDFLNLNLTKKIVGSAVDTIHSSQLPDPLKFISTRIVLLTLPLFAALDLVFFLFTELLCLSIGAIQLVGGKSPIYFESTLSPDFHLYQLAKILYHIIQTPIGFLYSFISPTGGLDFAASKKLLVKSLLSFQTLFLNKQIDSMEENEKLVLPISKNNEDSFSSLPSANSHILFLLIEKGKNGRYSAELIERGIDHAQTKKTLSSSDVKNLSYKMLDLRYSEPKSSFSQLVTKFFPEKGTLDLGEQGPLNNCPVTSLFATLQVLYHKDGLDFASMNLDFKRETQKHLGYLLWDLYCYPNQRFGIYETGKIIDEIHLLFNHRI
ncbi:hypothetical protein CSEC_1832 [Criblamydia sequanensis CRIB-18]|uniref:Uncharacterized protein n=1 Tax=Candidatus Criblamydia sequanensis CRIB-18 TaxID=1437425 RepID=A0A090D027_9BACT|nr:hypothetical protein CSEC_1832 [Criblamydia sequanensis CRIB-18]